MAYTLINTASAAPGASGGTTAAIDTTGANILIWSIGWWAGGGTVNTPNDSKANIWIPLTAYGPGQFATHRFWYAINPIVGPGHTFTVTSNIGTNAYPAQILYAFSNADIIAPFDVGSGDTIATATPLASGNVTPNQNNSLIITGYACHTNPGNGVETVTPTMSQIAVGSGPTGRVVTAYLIQSAVATVNPTWSVASGAAGFAVSTAVFKPFTVVPSTSSEKISMSAVLF